MLLLTSIEVLAQQGTSSEERFRVMADTTPSLVWMCDARGRITYLNGRRIAFTGTDSDAGYGDNWITSVHPDDVEHMLATLYEALKINNHSRKSTVCVEAMESTVGCSTLRPHD
jgi:PAS domain S-box-containing protein